MHEEHIEGAAQDHAQGVQIGLCLVIVGVIVLRIESDQTAQTQWLGDSEREWKSYKLNGHKSPRYVERVGGVRMSRLTGNRSPR